MSEREDHITFKMNYCQHYDVRRMLKVGCKAGCDIEATQKDLKRTLTGWRSNSPCIGGHKLSDPLLACPKWLRVTRKEGEEYADRIIASTERFMVVMPVVKAWRSDPPRDRQETIECPACKGRLHLSESAYNGHVHGSCETPGCVKWLE